MWSTAFVKAPVYSYIHVYGALVMYEIVLTQNPHKWTTQMHCSSMEDVYGFDSHK